MMSFTIYSPQGEILRSGCVPEEQLALQVAEGEAVITESSDHRRQYVEGGQVLDMPPRPSLHHIFDYATKTWIDPRTLQALKEAKWQEIKQARTAAEFGGFVWDGARFDSDAISQSRIQGAVQIAAVSPDFSQDWTLADNRVRNLKAQDMAAVGAALGAHVATLHSQARALRLQIDAAMSAAQLQNIHWPIASSVA